MNKQIGIIGLGKMGGNIARRLTEKGWKVSGYNRTAAVTQKLEKEGIIGAYSLEELILGLPKPRVIITILTAGAPTDEMLAALLPLLEPEDIVLEFSNSLYLDTVKRGKMFEKKKIKFIDVGISGGPGGALNGACLMVGGDKKTFEQIKPLLASEARPGALMHFEGIGAGHFVKMVHNGIEYGMMQSIAEGFNLLKNGPYKNLKMTDITSIYMNGSVVESRLVGWLADAFKTYGDNLTDLSGSVGYTGEGEWTAKIAKKFKLPSKVISDSVQFRIDSQKKPSFAGKILTGMRNAFGGHSIERGKMT
ncbi:MAG TPA: NADP-dependent phosphogluconate dehydrogenase [Candidatus Levybacteria bacterium]|nr:NADP-dependent phosphogluconate dehydrogenase [Candidatus Levybacteria bacterium]